MKRILIVALVAASAAGPVASAQSYPDFSSTAGLTLNGSAAQNGNKLTLTPAAGGLAGSAFTTSAVALGTNASFSSVFTFEILQAGGLGPGADGLTFAVHSSGANALGGGGGGLGFSGILNSLAVEFDTFDNGEFGGSNHVGIDLNGNLASIASSPFLTPDFDNAGLWWAWIDYDGVSQVLDVRWAQSATRPLAAMLSASGLDLSAILGGTNGYVGFTAGTGGGFGEHNITSWSLAPGGAVITPEPGTLMLMSTGLGLVGFGVRRRRA